MDDLFPDRFDLEERLQREPAALFFEVKTRAEYVAAIIEGQRAIYAGEAEFAFIKRDLPKELDFKGLCQEVGFHDQQPTRLNALSNLDTSYQDELRFIREDQKLSMAASQGVVEEFVILNMKPDGDWHVDQRDMSLSEKSQKRGVATQTAYLGEGAEVTPLSNIKKIKTLPVGGDGGNCIIGFELQDEAKTFSLPEGWTGLWNTNITPHRSFQPENIDEHRLNIVSRRLSNPTKNKLD
jgi:hypothetical protein